MNQRDILDKLGGILDAGNPGVLATIDEDGKPRVRWLTPVILPGHPGAIYALTVPRSPKVAHLRTNPSVEWMFQTPAFSEVLSIRGRIHVVDNPSLRRQVLEALGQRLTALWRLTHDVADLSALETVIEEATCYLPMDGSREVVSFSK